MPNFQRLRQALAPNPMPSQGRSALVQMLMAQSMRTPNYSTSLAESANIAAPQILAALLAKREDKARQSQQDTQDARLQALAGQLSRATQGAAPGEDPRVSAARQEAATRAMTITAGGVEQSPLAQAILGAQAQRAFAGPAPRDIREGADGEFVEFFSDGRPPQVIRQATAKPESSDDIREYQYAVANDKYTGTFEEWLTKQNAGKASSTTVNVGDASIPEGLQKAAIESSARADTLRNQVAELSTFASIAADAETGGLAPITLPIKQVLKDIGVDVGEGVPLLEAFKAQENQMALRLRNPDSGFGLTGNTSNRDIEFLTGAVASLGKTPEGNQAILTIMLAKQRRDAQLEDMKSEYIWSNGTLKGWADVRNKFIESNPLFTPQEQQQLDGLKRSALGRQVVLDPTKLTDEQLKELSGE